MGWLIPDCVLRDHFEQPVLERLCGAQVRECVIHLNANWYETLSKAKNMSVAHLENAGLVASKAGKVRLRRREELPEEWKPRGNTVWEITQRMIYALQEGKGALGGGEVGAANILGQVLSLSESVRDLAYRLYTVCERQGWAQEALAYNALITSWTQITDLAYKGSNAMQQEVLF